MMKEKRKPHPNSRPPYRPTKIYKWAKEQSDIGYFNNWKVGGAHSWTQKS